MAKQKFHADGTPKQPLFVILRNNLRMVGKIIRYSPHVFVSNVLGGVIAGLRSAASAWFTVALLNGLDVGTPLSELLWYIGIYAAFLVFARLFGKVNGFLYEPWAKQKLDVSLNRELFDHVHHMDEACFDDPEFYDDYVYSLNRTCGEADNIVSDLKSLLEAGISFFSVIGIMLTLDWVVALVIAVLSVLTVICCSLNNRLWYRQSLAYNRCWRLSDYISRVFRLPDRAKELRTSRVSELLLDQYDRNTEEMSRMDKEFGKKNLFIWAFLGNLPQTVAYYAIIVYMLSRLQAGTLAIGAFVASITVAWNVKWNLQEFIDRISNFPRHSLFLERYFGFLANEPRVKSGKEPVPVPESIEFRNVSFSYDFSQNMRYDLHEKDWICPQSEHGNTDALKNVSLTVRRGEKIAIVGYNGAGKTTLIKLLLRLYDPTEGQILMNGRDIREYNLEEYRQKIGAVFQDFKIFAATVAENVMQGDYNPETDKETVLRALDLAGFSGKLAELPQGVDTSLTREFDPKGTNLSGGEGQKVAIARVFARPYDLIVMDEPSSALDPIAEYELNETIREQTEGKTVIFISHRLSTTRMADRIYMFEKGELIESGSHDELMRQNGKYAEIFNLQAEKYKANAGV